MEEPIGQDISARSSSSSSSAGRHHVPDPTSSRSSMWGGTSSAESGDEFDYENAFIGPFGKKRRILFERMQQVALHRFQSPRHSPKASPPRPVIVEAPRPVPPGPLLGPLLQPKAAAPVKRTSKNFRCEQCNKEFTQRRNYEYHRSKHEGTMQFAGTCPICNKTFSNKDYLSSHMKIHCNSREYKCEWCSKSFNQRTAYNMHIRIHTGYKPHVCQICTKAFSRKGILRLHLRTHLEKKATHECKTCQKSYTNELNLRKHESVHGEYGCEVCGRTFLRAHLLKTHMKEHTNVAAVGAHKCPQCGASFHNSTRLKSHTKKCSKSTGDTHSSLIDPLPGSSRADPPGLIGGAIRYPSFTSLKMPLLPARPTVIRTAGPAGSVPRPMQLPAAATVSESAPQPPPFPFGHLRMPASEAAEGKEPAKRIQRKDFRTEEHCE